MTTARKFAELLDYLIFAVARDATATEDGGYGEYQDEKAAVLAAFNKTALDEREQFCAVLSNSQPMGGEAAIVLCGEDAAARVEATVALFRIGAVRHVVLTGGVHQPPRWFGAEACFTQLFGEGIAFDRITIDPLAQDTQEQARNTVQIAIEREWTQLLLVASAYHAPRAFLTFVAELTARDVARRIRLVNVAARAPWWDAPDGMSATRLTLLRTERAKIERYQAAGHVASYTDGLAYLEYWESR